MSGKNEGFSRSIREMCQLFFDLLGINYVGYGRAFRDGTHFDLSSDGNWVEHFDENKYQGIGYTGKPFYSGVYTSETGLNELMPIWQFQNAANAFNMDHPIVMINKHSEFYEYFLITSPRENLKN